MNCLRYKLYSQLFSTTTVHVLSLLISDGTSLFVKYVTHFPHSQQPPIRRERHDFHELVLRRVLQHCLQIETLEQSLYPTVLKLYRYYDGALSPSTLLLELDPWNTSLRQTGLQNLWKLQTCCRKYPTYLQALGLPDIDISIVMSIVKRPTGQSTRSFVGLRWLRSSGALHGIVKADYHLGRATPNPGTGITRSGAINTTRETRFCYYWL